MSENNTDAVVSAILRDLMLGATSPWEIGCFHLHRAVHALRTTAGNSDSSITLQQCVQLDTAIRTAQPYMVDGDQAAHLRFMVGALHVITREWANPDRQAPETASGLVLEAFIMARILDNWLDSCNLINTMLSNRSGTDEEQVRSFRSMVDTLYPLPEIATHGACAVLREREHQLMADLADILNTMIAEANSDGPEAMRRVAETMINRAAIRGLTLGDVVRQPHQYDGLLSPGPAAVQAQQNPTVRQTAADALRLALQAGDPTNGADHYLNPNLANPNWANVLPTTGDYENHRFFASRPVPQDALSNVLSQGRELVWPAHRADPGQRPAHVRAGRRRPERNLRHRGQPRRVIRVDQAEHRRHVRR